MEPLDWQNDEKMRTVYDREVEKLFKEQLELPDIVYGSTGKLNLRGPPLPGAPPGLTPPATFYGVGVHGDYCMQPEQYKARCRGVHDDSALDAAAAALYEEIMARDDVAGYNRVIVWRPMKPMSEPLRHMPMCFCDPNTIKRDEMVAFHGFGTGLDGPGFRLKHSPDQRWYYFPDMTVDECVVFKVYEEWKGQPQWPDEGYNFLPIMHAAFDDPLYKKGVNQKRNSNEFRPWFYHPKKKVA